MLILIYIAAAGLMLRPRTGCEKNPDFPGKCFAPDGKDEVKAIEVYDDQPLVEWDVAIVFTFVQM